MGSRMDKYNNTDMDDIPKRSDRNKELYKQIYNAYDEFENLVVPSNAKEIDLSTLKREISSRDEYKKIKDYGDITNNKIIRKEIVQEEQKKENEIYDINVLIKNAVMEDKNDIEDVGANDADNYLKKLKLDEMASLENDDLDDIVDEEELMKTANLSLEILSDLKGENDNTVVEAPINDEFIEDDDSQFYSGQYKFSDKDFNKKNSFDESLEEEEDDSKGGFLLKLLLCFFGIAVIALAILLII